MRTEPPCASTDGTPCACASCAPCASTDRWASEGAVSPSVLYNALLNSSTPTGARFRLSDSVCACVCVSLSVLLSISAHAPTPIPVFVLQPCSTQPGRNGEQAQLRTITNVLRLNRCSDPPPPPPLARVWAARRRRGHGPPLHADRRFAIKAANYFKLSSLSDLQSTGTMFEIQISFNSSLHRRSGWFKYLEDY